MLVTLRVPISDARGFSADPLVAESVVLPGWAEGEFLRGVGRITRRPGGIVEPWPFEASFANGRHLVTVPPDSLLAFAREQRIAVEAVRKRAWQALEQSTALLDVDLAFQIAPPARDRSNWTYSSSASDLAATVGALAALPVRVRGDDPTKTRRLLTVGPPLAERYAAATSAAADSRRLVGAGRITAVVEAAGVDVAEDFAARHETLALGRITLTSVDVAVPGGGALRCHLLHSASRSTGDRKRIRELRIHILRLHSIFELMRFLTSPTVTGAAAGIADTPGSSAFDRLQKTMLQCVRTVRTDARPGGADAQDLLDTALFARRLVDLDMQNMLTRMLSAARPKVRREIEAVLENERAKAAAGSTYVVNVSGGVVGNIGDHGTAHIAGAPARASAEAEASDTTSS